MKKVIILFGMLFFVNFMQAQEVYSPYFKVASLNSSITEVVPKISTALNTKGFEVVGGYAPEANQDFYVICYTRADLKEVALKFKDRGALASVLKIALKNENRLVTVSMLNPMYLFYAYLLDDVDMQEKQLQQIDTDSKEAMSAIGEIFEPFGGEQTKKELQKYHYKIMMPYFTDPIELQEFISFKEGLDIIQNNLKVRKNNTLKVYELVFPEKEIAVFGVGLLNEKDGEQKFLPIIGEDHLAAMPYEIILEGTELTMLHGKYRFALLWPELNMGTFMKIMSTPADVEDMMESLSEKE